MIVNNYAWKYEILYNGPFMITQCCTNRTFTLKCVAINIRHNICHINPYTSDTNIEDINVEKYVWW